MMHGVRGLGLAATLVLVSSVAVVPEASAASTPSTAAHVYVQIQGSQGSVYGFNASSTGQLSTISGAPFKPAGLIVGATSTKFFTLGQTLIHSYGIGSNGAIQSQLAQMPILDYAGSGCGGGTSGQDGAVLDHTGKYIYVMLEDNFTTEDCAAYQSYKINSDGSFAFDGDTEYNWKSYGGYDAGLPSILGNESFAYTGYVYTFGPALLGFRRESSGTLELMQFQETDPTIGGGYTAVGPDASPAGNYVVLQLFPGDVNPPQLGSFTVDSEGNLSTTNTSSNMPTSALFELSTTFSPSGDFLVAYSTMGGTNGNGGIEIYKFNGAAPLTLYKTLLSGTPIDQVAWDSSNHLYAMSKSGNKLYVFTVTATSVVENTSITIGSPFKMVVASGAESSGTTAQFEAPLLTTTGTLAVDGQVTIDTTGNTTVEVTGQAASKVYTLAFCPAVDASLDHEIPACFNVTTLATDSSGNGSATVKFPKSGNWAGEFSVNDSSGTAVVQSGLFPNVKDETYMSTLLPETQTNGGVVTTNTGQGPLTSGSVSYSDGTVLFTLKGASPSTVYELAETEGRFLHSSSSYGLSPSITTDASGNGSSSVDLATQGTDGGDMFEAAPNYKAGFIGGFAIP